MCHGRCHAIDLLPGSVPFGKTCCEGEGIAAVHKTDTCRKKWVRGIKLGINSGTKKEPKPKLFGPDIFRWGRGLPREGVGAKKFGMSLETREIKLFVGRDIPGFCRDVPAVPEKIEKKKFVFNSRPL